MRLEPYFDTTNSHEQKLTIVLQNDLKQALPLLVQKYSNHTPLSVHPCKALKVNQTSTGHVSNSIHQGDSCLMTVT